LRTDLAQKWPQHNTSAFPHEIIAAGANKTAGRGLFEATFEFRRLHDPAGLQKAGLICDERFCRMLVRRSLSAADAGCTFQYWRLRCASRHHKDTQ